MTAAVKRCVQNLDTKNMSDGVEKMRRDGRVSRELAAVIAQLSAGEQKKFEKEFIYTVKITAGQVRRFIYGLGWEQYANWHLLVG